jgi:hypothetical protein
MQIDKLQFGGPAWHLFHGEARNECNGDGEQRQPMNGLSQSIVLVAGLSGSDID